MKKTIIMAAAIALTLASCGSKTQSNTAGADSAATETVDTTAEEAAEAADVEAALTPDSKATVENLGAELKKAIEAKDSKAAITTLANLQTIYKNLVAQGKLDEAKAYGSSIKQLVSENADAIKNVASGNVTIQQLVDGVANLPTSASATAEEAKAAISSDIANLASPTIAKGETAVKTAEAAAAIVKTAAKDAANQAVSDAKQKANDAVSNAKETAKAAAEKKVNEAKQKANDAVNDAASKALNKLLK